MFWDDDITQNIVEQTNLYSVQEAGSSISTTKDEIEKLLGLQINMRIVKMPNYEMFWAKETHYEQVASVMPLKRYKKLRQFLHVN
jgi:transketolase